MPLPDAQPKAVLYRFGDFEADRLTGELRKAGVRRRLSAQPFQVLMLLLERPGELLSREQIARELWPEGTFVDFEHGLNSAVNRIREALGDTAQSSRYIETLARRGYRFLAQVEPVPAPQVQDLVATEPAVKPAARALEDGPRSLLASTSDLPGSSQRVVRLLFLLLQGMYLGFYVGALANLAEIEDLVSPLAHATLILTVLIVTAAVLIPVRAFAIAASLFRPPGAQTKLLRLWRWLLLPADGLWSLAPLLLLHHFSVGLALACVALLLYAPFAQRSLILMGAVAGSE